MSASRPEATRAPIHVETVGQGSDLVLLHGWGLSAAVWSDLVPRLQARYRLTRVDLPGHGQTPPWPEGAAGLEPLLDALLARLPERAVWLGWSLGGLLSLAAAARRPDRVRALILVATTPRFVRGPDWPQAMDPDTLEGFRDQLLRDYSATLQRFMTLQVRGAEQGRVALKRLRASLRAAHEPDASAIAWGLELLRSVDLRSEVGAVRCPALVISGQRDTLVPVAAGRALASALPDGRGEVINGAGHAPFLSHPEQFLELLEEFLGHVCKGSVQKTNDS